VGIAVRVLVGWSVCLAACSFEPSFPATGGGNGGVPDAAPVAPDAWVVTTPDAMIDAPPVSCADADADGVCNDVDDWPCGAKPASPSATVTWNRNNGDTTITITNVRLDNTGRYAVATPGESLALRFDYVIEDTACPGNCVDQIELGWVPTGARWGWVFDNAVSKANGASGTIMTTIPAGSTKQVRDLRIELGQNFSCNYQGAQGWWDGQVPVASHTIAKLCVH
jgi:hypothetical protein